MLVLLIAACGSQAAAPRPAPPPPPPAPITLDTSAPPEPVTCGDVGVLLRGAVDDERDAGPDKEATIANACLHGKWSREVIDCIGSSATPRDCLANLTPAQSTAYRKQLVAWLDEYPDEELEDDHEELAETFIDCKQGIGDVSQYAPAITASGSRRELAVSLRRHHVLELCEEWDEEVKQCFVAGKSPAACRTLLERDQEQAVVDALVEVDTLLARVDARKGPATCDRVVKTHYADARWKGVLAKVKPAERARVIAESRKRMRAACNSEAWSEPVRACIVAAGGDACFHASGIAAWGFPPSVVPIKTGIPECDAYGDALRALVKCTAIPRRAAQSMLDGFQRAAPGYASMTGAQRTMAASNCKHSDAAIRQSAKSLGCTI